MATFTKHNDFTEQLLRGVHDFSTHTFKAAFTNTAPTAADDELADIVQISSGGGYTAGAGGGVTLDSVTVSEASGTAKVTLADEVFTASGGPVGPFQYVVIYNDTSTGDKIVGSYNRGSAITLADGESITLDWDPTNGLLNIV